MPLGEARPRQHIYLGNSFRSVATWLDLWGFSASQAQASTVLSGFNNFGTLTSPRFASETQQSSGAAPGFREASTWKGGTEELFQAALDCYVLQDLCTAFLNYLKGQLRASIQMMEADLAAWNTKKRPSHKAAFVFWDEGKGFQSYRALKDNPYHAKLGMQLSPVVESVAQPEHDPDWFNPKDLSKVRAAKSALHVSAAATLRGDPPCRIEQAQELHTTIRDGLASQQGCSIYVSGTPGSGKSLTVDSIVRQCASDAPSGGSTGGKADTLTLSVNCMSLSQPSAIFEHLLEKLEASAGQDCSHSAGSARERLKQQLTRPQQTPRSSSKRGRGRKTLSASVRRRQCMVVVVLDEVDRLIAQDQAVLVELLLLPQAPSSRLILIGIANSIDLTERCLPQLAALGAKPRLIAFPSYTAEQIGKLLLLRQASLPGPALQESALSMCARMVASRSGDMRRALEICVAAIDHLVDDVAAEEQDQREGHGQAKDCSGRLVRLAQMSRAISRSQGGSGASSAAAATIAGLPPQQQLVLCALLICLDPGRPSATALPSTPAKTPLKQRQVAAAWPSPMTPGKHKLSATITSPYHTPKKARRDGSGKMTPLAKGLGTPSKGTPGKGLAAAQHCLMGQLQDEYATVMQQVSMRPLGSMEFSATCSTLADLGLINMSTGAQGERFRRITLQAPRTDALLGLKNSRIAQDALSYASQQPQKGLLGSPPPSKLKMAVSAG
ncbi:hypothetical protein WJX73_000512 [Symbiochloris irregularis]|uniref:Uncharacterized protein n=1 Tax=Symbiochloris irregularis TaxID=706552 RepID=A0AAW1P5E7_9CHLO